MKKIDKMKKISSDWFSELQNNICEEIEIIEKKYSKQEIKFQKKSWVRDKSGSNQLGGGQMRILRGKVFEKSRH